MEYALLMNDGNIYGKKFNFRQHYFTCHLLIN